MFDDLYYAVYDVCLTNVAIFFYALYDQDVSFQNTNNEERIGFKLSHYYNHCRDKVMKRTIIEYFYWMIYAFAASAVYYFVPAKAYDMAIVHKDGYTDGQWTVGFACYSQLIIIHHVFVFICTRNYTWFQASMYLLSILFFMPLIIVLNDLSTSAYLYKFTFSGVYHQPQYWLSTLLGSAIVGLPYYALR